MSANAYEQSFTLSHGCANSPNPNTTGVVAKLGPDLSQMLYSTYYGGKTGGIRTAVPICNHARHVGHNRDSRRRVDDHLATYTVTVM